MLVAFLVESRNKDRKPEEYRVSRTAESVKGDREILNWMSSCHLVSPALSSYCDVFRQNGYIFYIVFFFYQRTKSKLAMASAALCIAHMAGNKAPLLRSMMFLRYRRWRIVASSSAFSPSSSSRLDCL